MSGKARIGTLTAMLAATAATFALAAAAASATAVPHPSAGRLPSFPVLRGVIPVLASKADVSAHEKLVNEAFEAARASRGSGGTPVPNEGALPRCLEEFEEELTFFTQDMCYRGGPVLHGPRIHLIFWQGEPGAVGEENVKAFPGSYEATVTRYFKDVTHDSGLTSDSYAVDAQYWEEQAPRAFISGEYKFSFEPATDVTVDNTAFPKHLTGGCTDATQYSEGPCLLDSDIQKEVEKVAGTSKGLGDIYLVLTPPGVGGCFESESGECAYRQYCAYHSDFGGDGKTVGLQTLYADLPYIGEVRGCDSGVHPNEELAPEAEEKGEDHGADAVIDTASHELNEAVTDPIGSQCDENALKAIIGCEKNAWTDAIGQEVADKCLPPETTIAGIYGEPLGELLPRQPASFYNQLVSGNHYWAQREWSNEAGLFEGACVQRAIGASFTVSAGAAATVPMTLDGSPSGAPGDPATYWVWNFGGGEQIGTASPTLSHTFAQAGEQLVALTAYDRYGNAEATVESFNVGPAPSPPPPPVTPAPLVIREPVTPGHLTAAQLAAKLGLPGNGKKLSGNGPFGLGHAECPPACGVTLQLYAKEPKVSHKRRTSRWVLAGSAHLTLSAKGAGSLTVSLNAKGRVLLHKIHRAAARLVVTVEGQEGGTWQIVRSLTLTR